MSSTYNFVRPKVEISVSNQLQNRALFSMDVSAKKNRIKNLHYKRPRFNMIVRVFFQWFLSFLSHFNSHSEFFFIDEWWRGTRAWSMMMMMIPKVPPVQGLPIRVSQTEISSEARSSRHSGFQSCMMISTAWFRERPTILKRNHRARIIANFYEHLPLSIAIN